MQPRVRGAIQPRIPQYWIPVENGLVREELWEKGWYRTSRLA